MPGPSDNRATKSLSRHQSHGVSLAPPAASRDAVLVMSPLSRLIDSVSRVNIRDTASIATRQTLVGATTAPTQRHSKATPSQAVRPLDTFHSFLRLPQELQIQILDFAAEAFCKNDSFHGQMCGRAMRISHFPSLLHTNRIARDVAFDVLRAYCMKTECKGHSIFFPEHSEAQCKKSLWIVDRISAPQDKWLEIRDFRNTYVEISAKEKKQRVQFMQVLDLQTSTLNSRSSRTYLVRCDVGSVDVSEFSYDFMLVNQPYGTVNVYQGRNREGVDRSMINRIGLCLAMLNKVIQGDKHLIRMATAKQMRLNDAPAHVSERARRN